MNREQNVTLLKHTGLAVLKRPDGGVVTQRTANPLSRAYFRDSSHNSPSVPLIAFQGLSAASANSAQVGRNPKGEKPKALNAAHESAVPEGQTPTPGISHSSTTPGSGEEQ